MSGKAIIKNTIKKWINSDDSTIEFFVLALLLSISFLFFYYDDMISTLDNSILFFKAIFNGKFFDFYQYSIDNVDAIWAANYEIPLYFIIGLWNFPVLLLNIFAGLDYLNSTFALLWCKAGLVVCVVLIYWVMDRIARLVEIPLNNKRTMMFMYFSSIGIVVPVFMIVQYDCISLFFILLGLYYYLKNENSKFLLCFIIAIPLKSFAFVLLPPLLLIKEKNLLKVIGYLIISISGLALCRLLYMNNEAYSITMSSQYGSAIESLLDGTITVGTHQVLFWVMVYCALILGCYLYKSEEQVQNNRMAIYSCLVAISSLVILGFMRTYWVILVVPFMILLIFMNYYYYKVNVLIDTIFGVAYVCFLLMRSLITDNMNTWIGRLLFRKIYHTTSAERKYTSAKEWLETLGVSEYYPLFITVFIFCLFAFLVINYPLKWKNTTTFEKIGRSVLWVRLFIIGSVIFAYLYVYVATTGSTIVDTLDDNVVSSKYDLLSEKSGIVQPIQFSKSENLHQLTLKFENPDQKAINMSSVRIVIKENDSKIFSKRIATNTIQTEEELTINLSGLKVSSNKEYVLEVSGVHGVKNAPDYDLYLFTNDITGALDAAMIDGIAQNYCIALEIK